MTCPALIQLPIGHWIDPTRVVSIVANVDCVEARLPKSSTGEVIIYLDGLPGERAFVHLTSTKAEADELRDEIAALVIKATELYHQSGNPPWVAQEL